MQITDLVLIFVVNKIFVGFDETSENKRKTSKNETKICKNCDFKTGFFTFSHYIFVLSNVIKVY